MTERQDGGLWPDGDIMASPDMKLPPVKETSEIDHIALSQMHLPTIQEAFSPSWQAQPFLIPSP